MGNNLIFKVGDILIDPATNEIGLLTERYDIFGGYFDYEIDIDVRAIWAWEILWTGSKVSAQYGEGKATRRQSFTELGLINLVRDGVLELIKVDEEYEGDNDADDT